MVFIAKDKLQKRILLALDWISDIAIKHEEQLTGELNPLKLAHSYWKGSIRNEYLVAKKAWKYYAPVWHSGQALKSLIQACEMDFIKKKQKYLYAAENIAQFILTNQVWDEADPNHGLFLAYEDLPSFVTTSGIFEGSHGLFLLSKQSGNNIYRERVLAALKFSAQNLYRKGEGLFNDAYDPQKGEIVNFYSLWGQREVGRPLNDDSIFLKAYKLTGEEIYKTIFWEIIDKLIKEENPPGNWVKYFPCVESKGDIHPRHAYWWGRPFIDAYHETGENKYLEIAKRACDWYVKAIRRDGGLFRRTFVDFNTESFGHATSGSACAVKLWLSYRKATNTKEYDDLIKLCLQYNMKMQFVKPADKNLLGCVLEKVLPPDGTDANPYYIRDLGTIFFIQAGIKYLKSLG